ncbi:Protein of unknown function [Bacillus wiedmannii]|nr:Protein of unknown function [Bacillus wiedmannii]
MTPEPAIETIA